jgi:DNA repair photolyase
MKITEVFCKTALSPSKLPGLDYSLNPYRGCSHHCAYCYVPNVLRLPRKTWGSFVEAKKNIPRVLASELTKKTRGTVGLSTVTDPYQPLEKKLRLTRYCLEQLLRYDVPVSVQTKSSLVQRDIDLLSRFTNAEVMMSMGTLHDEERRLLEPGTSSIKSRLETLRCFSDTPVKTSVFFGPIYPTVTMCDIPSLVDLFLDHGVHEIMIDRFHLKPGVTADVIDALNNDPSLKTRFATELHNNQSYYSSLHNMLHSMGQQKGLTVVDAF